MPNLTDTQLVILAAAAQRDDGAAFPLPSSLKIKGAALTRVLDGLVKKGLLEEKPASREAAVWRETKDGRRITLVISASGRGAIDGAPDTDSAKPPAPTKPNPKTLRGRAAKKKGGKAKSDQMAPARREGTKQALLIDLLKRKTGATIAEIVTATGWQAHSVRGAISGALRKKLGLAIASEKVDGRGRVYRIGGQG
jgi:DNA-binding MarR family transcriptional regulator